MKKAKYFYDKKLAFAMHQKELEVRTAIEKVSEFEGLSLEKFQANWDSLLSLF